MTERSAGVAGRPNAGCRDTVARVGRPSGYRQRAPGCDERSARSHRVLAVQIVLDLPISEIPLVFLDTETTGLNPRYGDRIVEVALARFQRGVMENFFVSLVNPRRPIGPGAARIHGITDDDVRDAPVFAEIVPQLCAELSETVIVAHNAPFDLGFIANEFQLARHLGTRDRSADLPALLGPEPDHHSHRAHGL